MSRVRVHCFSISSDGFAAGPNQSIESPLGVGGEELHTWAFKTQTFRQMFGEPGGSTGIDNDFALQGNNTIGAWILGRNMFGPIRGAWPDESWKGWWGENPPYHTPVFVLTNHARPPLEMEGGTVFHFVTGGIESALQEATAAARGKDIRLGGGVHCIQQYLRAALIDEMHVAITPTILGAGARLFEGINMPQLGYRVSRSSCGEGALHVVYSK